MTFTTISTWQWCSGCLSYYLINRRCMYYLCYLYLFMYTVDQHNFRIKWCPCRLIITRRVPLVRKKLWCSGRVSRSCSTCGTLRVALGTNPVICLNEYGKDNWNISVFIYDTDILKGKTKYYISIKVGFSFFNCLFIISPLSEMMWSSKCFFTYEYTHI